MRRAYRPELVAGAATVEVVTHRERTFPARQIVERAYSRASDPALAAMFRDSEAFVEWCTTGRLSAAPNVAVTVPGVAPAQRSAKPAPAKRSAKPPAKAAPAKRTAKRTPKRTGRARTSAKPARKTAARRPAARKAKAGTKRRR